MISHHEFGASLVAQMVKNMPVMQETGVQSLGWEDLLEKEMATPSSILAWKNPMNKGAWQATVHGGRKQWDTTEQLHCHFLFLRILFISSQW